MSWFGVQLSQYPDDHPELLISNTSYDETPLPTRVSDGTFHEERLAATKILQTDFQLASMVRDQISGRRRVVIQDVPAWLQCIDQNSTECLKEATSRVFKVPQALSDLNFTRRVRIVTTDHYGANFKCERSRLIDEEGELAASHRWSLLHVGCHVHDAHGVCGKMLDLVSGHCSGMISGAVGLSGHGQLDGFIRSMREHVDEKVQYVYDLPNNDAVRFKQHMLDLFLSLPPATHQSYKAVLRRRVII
eukprot:8444263-Pyramimonas_sp.AAC.1